MREFREGKREGSVISHQTVESLSADERQLWRSIRKELEEIGITVDAFNANKDFIFDWFVRALETGAFEEQTCTNVSITEPCPTPVPDDPKVSGNPTISQDSCRKVNLRTVPQEMAPQIIFCAKG